MNYPVSEALLRDECLALLAQSRIGHVGGSVAALPVIVPVRYAVIGDSVPFWTFGANDLLRATVGAVVALEMTDAAALERGRALLSDPWSLGEQADRFVIVPMTFVSGRRFVEVC